MTPGKRKRAGRASGRANNAHSTEQLSSKPAEEQRGRPWVRGKGEWQERRWEGGLGSHKPHSEECEVSPTELGQFSKVFNSDMIKAVFE